MEKIILINYDMEKHRDLLRCLEILFPECVIESENISAVNNPHIFNPEKKMIIEKTQ